MKIELLWGKVGFERSKAILIKTYIRARSALELF